MIRVLWVPTRTTLETASYRLQCHYPNEWLKEHGFETTVFDYDDFPRGKSLKGLYDFLIWMRPECLEEAFSAEVPVVAFVSDGPMVKPAALLKVKAIVTDSPQVALQIPVTTYAPIRVIPVAAPGDIDRRQLQIQLARPMLETVRLLWIGGEQNYLWAKETLDHLAKRFSVEIISRGAFATKQWNLNTVTQDIRSCHIGVLPYPAALRFGDTKGFKPLLKDIDRITLLQACGLPVIAAPLPCWQEYIRQGVDGIVADGPEEFEAAVELFCNAPHVYDTIANAGFIRAWMTASPTICGNKWKTLLEDLHGRSSEG